MLHFKYSSILNLPLIRFQLERLKFSTRISLEISLGVWSFYLTIFDYDRESIFKAFRRIQIFSGFLHILELLLTWFSCFKKSILSKGLNFCSNIQKTFAWLVFLSKLFPIVLKFQRHFIEEISFWGLFRSQTNGSRVEINLRLNSHKIFSFNLNTTLNQSGKRIIKNQFVSYGRPKFLTSKLQSWDLHFSGDVRSKPLSFVSVSLLSSRSRSQFALARNEWICDKTMLGSFNALFLDDSKSISSEYSQKLTSRFFDSQILLVAVFFPSDILIYSQLRPQSCVYPKKLTIILIFDSEQSAHSIKKNIGRTLC